MLVDSFIMTVTGDETSIDLRPKVVFADGRQRILWNLPRKEVPPLLVKKGVPLQVWKDTQLVLAKRLKDLIDRMTFWLSVDDVVCGPLRAVTRSQTSLKNMQDKIQQNNVEEWRKIAEQEYDIYIQYGLEVSLVTDKESIALGMEGDSCKYAGLQFTLASHEAILQAMEKERRRNKDLFLETDYEDGSLTSSSSSSEYTAKVPSQMAKLFLHGNAHSLASRIQRWTSIQNKDTTFPLDEEERLLAEYAM
jgi:hypothetical protein